MMSKGSLRVTGGALEREMPENHGLKDTPKGKKGYPLGNDAISHLKGNGKSSSSKLTFQGIC